MFYPYKWDKPKLLEKCFEEDWKRCEALPKLIKNPEELQAIHDMMKKGYRVLREGYKYWSAYNPACLAFDIWSVSQNAFGIFAEKCHIYNENFRIADMNINFIAVNSKGDKKCKNNKPKLKTDFGKVCPESLTRHQRRMEGLGRMTRPG